MREGLKISGAAVIAFFLVVALVIGIWVFRVATADVKGRGDTTIQTKGNANYRIAAYDHFYDLCAAAQTMQQNAAGTQALLDAATEPSEKDRLTVTLQAQKNRLNELVNQYNADASKAGTIGQFKASDLPFVLNASEEISCTA